jgi:hypothetical protein
MPTVILRDAHVGRMTWVHEGSSPPASLLNLPELPQELAYRFAGRDLTLVDIKERLIVDLIPNAIP